MDRVCRELISRMPVVSRGLGFIPFERLVEIVILKPENKQNISLFLQMVFNPLLFIAGLNRGETI